MKQNHLAALTSLRFCAAALVVAQHYFGFSMGHAGVSFFFILSGFILAYSYRHSVDTKVALGNFLVKRFARIYPAHFVTLLASLPFAYAALRSDGNVLQATAQLLSHLFLTQSFVPNKLFYFSMNAPAWSISDEAFFYICFPGIVVLLKGIRSSRIFMLAASCFLVSVSAASLWYLNFPDTSVSNDLTHWLFYINPIYRISEFFIGICLGLAFVERPWTSNILMEILAVALAVVTLTSASRLGLQMGVFVCSIWFVPASVGMISAFAHSRGRLSKILNHKWFVVLGEASFMIYMIHLLALRYSDLLFGESVTLRIILAAFVVILSVVMHYKFEVRARRWIIARFGTSGPASR